jgi:N-acetyl-beta-hexosaminidase
MCDLVSEHNQNWFHLHLSNDDKDRFPACANPVKPLA